MKVIEAAAMRCADEPCVRRLAKDAWRGRPLGIQAPQHRHDGFRKLSVLEQSCNRHAEKDIPGAATVNKADALHRAHLCLGWPRDALRSNFCFSRSCSAGDLNGEPGADFCEQRVLLPVRCNALANLALWQQRAAGVDGPQVRRQHVLCFV